MSIHQSSRVHSPHTAKRVRRSAQLFTTLPFEDLVEKIERELAIIKDRIPNSDVVSCFESFRRDLKTAMNDASDVDVHMTLEELFARTHIPISTLRRHCNELGDLIGARKRTSVWIVHWPTFDRYKEWQAEATVRIAA